MGLIKRTKNRWKKGETGLQKAALFISKKTGWSGKSKGSASRAIGKLGESTAKKQRDTKDLAQVAKTRKSGKSITAKAGFSDKERVALKQKHEDWKANRAKMQKMRKENPKKYREIKRAERKNKRRGALGRGIASRR